MTTVPSNRKVSRTKIDLLLDIALALLFVVVMENRFTGQNLHELIGVGFGIGLLVHIILHWRWIISLTRTFFRNLLHGSRLNYVLNLILFVDLLVIIVTGLGISRTLGLSLGLERSLTQTLERLHLLASDLSLLIIGLHVGLHWKWIASNIQRYLLRLPFHLAPRRAAIAPAAIAQTTPPTDGGQA